MRSKSLTYDDIVAAVGADVPLGWHLVIDRLKAGNLEIRKRSKLAPLMSSESQDHETPDRILDLVRQVSSSGQIGLDPCTNDRNPTNAVVYFTPKHDGLVQPWTNTFGIVFVNPPYGGHLRRWAPKIAYWGHLGVEIIALVPGRIDTQWWKHMNTATARCEWEGRIKFRGAQSGAPFPSCLLYWGPRADEFRRVFGAYGHCS